MAVFDDDDFAPPTFDGNGLKKNGVSWWTRVLLRAWPRKGIARLTREFGMDPALMEKAHDLFSRVRRVDVFPSASSERGFQIVLDRSTALYFHQEGDHFVFDGPETGKYGKGDVTIFDGMKE